MIRLTRTGTLFLGVLVALYLASLTSQSGLLLLLIGLVSGCYVVNALAAWRTVRGITVHPPAHVHLSEGQKLTQPWRVANPGRHAAGFVRIESKGGVMLRLASVPAHSEASLTSDLIYWKRGVYPYTQVRLGSTYPFGFVQARRQLAVRGEVVVWPAVYPTHPAHAAGFDVMFGGKFHGRRRTGTGAQFAGVRPIQPGDSLKQVHWKSSAKGLGLMVKTFDEELSGRAAIILYCGPPGPATPAAAPGPAILDDPIIDRCVRAAGSLVFATLDAGHHVEWIDLGHQEHLVLSPFDDGHAVLDRLARLQPDSRPLTASALHHAVEACSRKSAINLVLTAANAAVWEIATALKAQGRSVAVYLPERGPLPEGGTAVPSFVYGEHEMRRLQ